MTHGRAAVQVKSQANQKTLDDYARRIDEAAQYKAFFFVCHTWQGPLPLTKDGDNVHALVGRELAQAVLRTGLQEWVLRKSPPKNWPRRLSDGVSRGESGNRETCAGVLTAQNPSPSPSAMAIP